MKTAKDDLKTTLSTIAYLPNAVAAWLEAHGGDKRLAASNAEKLRQAEDLMSQILASMPNSKTYRVVGLDKTVLNFSSEAELVAFLATKNVKKTSSASTYGGTRRIELDGAPMFDKLIGPIYDGPGVCRYETQAVYNSLFD